MSVLSVQKISKAFGERALFSDISFEVAEREHIGLCGANGVGKTTLFRMLRGEERPDSGEVHRAKLLKAVSMEQIPVLQPGQTAYELALEVFLPVLDLERELQDVAQKLSEKGAEYDKLVRRQANLQEQFERQGGLTCRARARSSLLGLGFMEEELQKPAEALSGGQLNKVLLARLLLSEANLLLLDEPTNHLDILATEWLEKYLKAYTGAFIVISHDRYFLDQVTNRTLELAGGKLYSTEGNYTRHVELRMDQKEFARRKYRNTQKEIRRIEGIVEQQRRWNRERNIRTAESKLKQIAKLRETLVEPEKEQAGIRFGFRAKETGGNDVLMAENLQKAFGKEKLFENVSLHIRRGERVFLLGPNGCGKTTLLNILAHKTHPDAGVCFLGAGIELACYEQHMRGMAEERTVLQEIWEAYPRMGRTHIHNALAAFLFRGTEVEKRIGMLSGGERARVQLLKLMLSEANLLLLDEPTNHLDIASREALEEALEEFDGAYLIVTHDRYLVNRLADRVLYMQKDGLMETLGGYDAFVQALCEMPENEMEEEAGRQERPENEYQARKAKQVSIARAREALSRMEKDIAAHEEQLSRLEDAILQPEAQTDYQLANELLKKLEIVRETLAPLYGAWEDAADEIEALQNDRS